MKHNLQKIILQVIAEAERIAQQEIAQSTLERLRERHPASTQERKVKPRYVINRTIKRLHERGMITITVTETRNVIGLTSEGEERLKQLQGYTHLVNTQSPWDGVWRIVIMDIGEHKRRERSVVRQVLKQVGFVLIRKSVWAFPYSCTDCINELKEDLDLRDELILLEATSIDYEDELRNHFGL